ncbi:hypothetical protein P7K49_039636, partial [Saguinus oedipus]
RLRESSHLPIKWHLVPDGAVQREPGLPLACRPQHLHQALLLYQLDQPEEEGEPSPNPALAPPQETPSGLDSVTSQAPIHKPQL